MLNALPDWVTGALARAASSGEDIAAALDIAAEVGARLPRPGAGRTVERWTTLAGLGRVNLTVARVVEAHTDALAILAEAGRTDDASETWGVFAAEAPGARLTATQTAGGWVVNGVKPWCSLGAVLARALVTAHIDDGRQLFAIDLRHPGVRAEPAQEWVSRGLRTVTSVPIHCASVPAEPVGEPGWYLRRAGFAWGGLGVAACWYGGAAGLALTLMRTAAERRGPLDALHVGTVDAALHAAATALLDAARQVDAGQADAETGVLLAHRVRAVVADAVDRVQRQVGHALGPTPLAFDADYAARVADLQLYVRQHHAERDLASLGELLLTERL
ncbi:MAG: acyl-CoA dehydrogenase [Actinomycetota bacterium]|nr:acyl-CoA dehydrogenase [Actinomycetota bacterium]